MHADYKTYGSSSLKYAPWVAERIRHWKPDGVLDYGAGKGNLAKALAETPSLPPFKLTPYEPAAPEWSATPQPHTMVVSIDVLEHIEPDLLENVLADIRRVTQQVALVTIHTGPAKKILPDGRNAHLIQQPAEWWLPKLQHYFSPQEMAVEEKGFRVELLPR